MMPKHNDFRSRVNRFGQAHPALSQGATTKALAPETGAIPIEHRLEPIGHIHRLPLAYKAT
jgi:hypothetical protein